MPESPTASKKKLFVIDTNVLIHQPLSIFHMEEHDIVLCLAVIGELNKHKKGIEMKNRSARMAGHFIDELIALGKQAGHNMFDGVPLSLHKHGAAATGSIIFQNAQCSPAVTSVPYGMDEGDWRILETAKEMQKQHPGREVIIITNDTLMSISCEMYGVPCEWYRTDAVINDSDIFRTGIEVLPPGYFDGLECTPLACGAGYILPPDENLKIGTMLLSTDKYFKRGFVTDVEDGCPVVATMHGFTNGRRVFGLNEKNEEQGLIMWALMNPEIHLVTIAGVPGTGKTLLALAAGLEQTVPGKNRPELYDGIVMFSAMVPTTKRDVGFLPGELQDKLSPWFSVVEDCLDVFCSESSPVRDVTRTELSAIISRETFNYELGRTRHRRFLIVDESQNLTPEEVDLILTRAGEGTKVVFMGNVRQIYNHDVNAATCGLSYLISRWQGNKRYAHVMLQKNERSELSRLANAVSR